MSESCSGVRVSPAGSLSLIVRRRGAVMWFAVRVTSTGNSAASLAWWLQDSERGRPHTEVARVIPIAEDVSTVAELGTELGSRFQAPPGSLLALKRKLVAIARRPARKPNHFACAFLLFARRFSLATDRFRASASARVTSPFESFSSSSAVALRGSTALLSAALVSSRKA
jgi:hypothetical protein